MRVWLDILGERHPEVVWIAAGALEEVDEPHEQAPEAAVELAAVPA
jgi:hypothetical protein